MPQLNVKGIKRVNEFADPEIIEQTEVTIFKNFVLDKEGGKAVKRGAYKSYNINSPSGGLVLRSLHDVIDSAGANYLIGQSGTIFQKSLDGTGAWSSVKTGLTTGLKTRIATYNNRFFVTNGTDEVFETNLTTAWDLELDRPNVASVTTAHSSGGSLGAPVRYRWMLVYVTNKGEQSDISIPIGHAIADNNDGDTTSSTYRTVTLSNLPVSSDTRVTGRKLYRTEGDGTTFYLLKYLDNTDTTFADSYADTVLDTSDYVALSNTPTKAQHLTIHKNRLFLANIVKKTINNVFGKPAILPFILTPADNGSSGISDGTYKYKFSYLYDSGEESELSPEVSVLLDKNSYAWTINFTKVVITNIPQPYSGASDAYDPKVVKVRVYRTNINGSTLYWLKDLTTPNSNSTTDADNTTLSTVYPKSGYGGASTTALNSAVVFSEIDKPAEFPALNIFQIFPDDGDDIVGIFSEEDGLLIFKENSICKLYTQGSPYNWRLSKLYENRGCDTVGTIAESPQGYYFVNNKHVYRFPDNLITPISMPVKTTIEAATGRYHAEYISSLSWFILSINGYLLVYDEKLEAWYKFVTDSTSADIRLIAEKKHGTYAGNILITDTHHFTVLRYDTTTSLDYDEGATPGANDREIVTVLATKMFTVNDPNKLVRPRKLFVSYKKKDGQNVVHTITNPDSGNAPTNTDSTNSTYANDYKRQRIVTDGMTGTVIKTCAKIKYTIQGAEEFNALSLEYNVINRGSRV